MRESCLVPRTNGSSNHFFSICIVQKNPHCCYDSNHHYYQIRFFFCLLEFHLVGSLERQPMCRRGLYRSVYIFYQEPMINAITKWCSSLIDDQILCFSMMNFYSVTTAEAITQTHKQFSAERYVRQEMLLIADHRHCQLHTIHSDETLNDFSHISYVIIQFVFLV